MAAIRRLSRKSAGVPAKCLRHLEFEEVEEAEEVEE
jgi:hypothetical protein